MNAADEAAVERIIGSAMQGGRPPTITDPAVLHRVAAILETRNEAPANTDASHESLPARIDQGRTRAA